MGRCESGRPSPRARVERLLDHREPAALLRAWAASEVESIVELKVADEYARSLLSRDAIKLSGISHSISFMSPSMAVEIRAPKRDARRIEREAPEGRIKLIVHAAERPWSIGEVAVDLVLHNGSREDQGVERILERAR